MLTSQSKTHENEFIQKFIQRTGEPLGLQVDLTEKFNLTQFKVYHEILHPGHRSSGYHFHSHKEEFLFVLKGNPSIKTVSGIKRLSPFESYGIPPVPETSHMVVNDSDKDAEILIVFVPSEQDAVIYQELT